LSNGILNSEKQFVVVGGGLYSLILIGALLNEGVEPQRILLIESSNHLGGQFRSDVSKNQMLFDKGTRILYETGDQRADKFIKRVIERCPSSVLSGNRKDVGGTFSDGQFNFGSVYPSFHGLPSSLKVQILGEILMSIENQCKAVSSSSITLFGYLEERFGATARDLIHEPICQKLFRRSSADLSNRVLQIIPLNRLSGLSHQSMLMLASSEALRSRLAFPDQLELPKLRQVDFCGYYPKSFGIQNYVHIAENLIREAGVDIRLGWSVAGIRKAHQPSVAAEVLLRNQGGDLQLVTAERQVIWTLGLRALWSCSGLSDVALPEDPKEELGIIHFTVRDNTFMGGLYYAYCHDPKFRLFRLTNYSSYSGGVTGTGTFPITAEILADGMTDTELISTAAREIRAIMGSSIGDEAAVQYVGMSKGFLPVPDIRSESFWVLNSKKLAEYFDGTLASTGLMTGRPKFLGRDVVSELLSQIDAGSV